MVIATHTHTLDKNGSLYDPAGTESWNMQIGFETTKLTKYPTIGEKVDYCDLE